MSFYIDHYVTARVSKYAYGTSSSALYDENNPEHFSRTHKKYVDLPGDVMIGDLFSTILPMVVLLFDGIFHAEKKTVTGSYS